MAVETISFKNGTVRIIDQRELPLKLCYIECSSAEDIWRAIKTMQIRGAPAIGIAAGFGMWLGIKDLICRSYKDLLRKMDESAAYLLESRPTAVNLRWALERIRKTAEANKDKNITAIKGIILEEAVNILREDKKICRSMAEYGAGLIKEGDNVLTHCNAGGLATAGCGTALGVMFRAKELGIRFHVYADETRPLLQGARLTSWELMQRDIPCTLICDNTAGFLMKQKRIDIAITGADRIAANGDTANKIGTYTVASMCRIHNIPFYVAAPASTFDTSIPNGEGIPIEEREACEVTDINGRRTSPQGVKVYSPAFDITPAEYITAFITERGMIRPPYTKNITSVIT